MRNLKRANAGFTIIETLFVLAIAGVIMLIVFEAIPTLQRNSRNSERKQDVSLILDAVSHYEINDSGNFPSPCGPAPTYAHTCASDAGPSSPNDYFLKNVQNKMAFYDPTKVIADVQQYSGAQTPQAKGPDTDIDAVQVWDYLKCDPNNQGKTIATGAGYNDIVALYATEDGSGGPTSICQQL